MKKVSFKMAAMLVVLAALVICGFSNTSVYAAHEMAGSALLFTYYDVRSEADGGMGTSDNYFTVTNTSASWVQAHVRVRTGEKSIELLDFDVMLSPNDVFSFTLSDSGAGGVDFTSLDAKTISNSKMIKPFLEDLGGGVEGIWFSTDPLSSHYTSNMTSQIELCRDMTRAEAMAMTLKGYVEVIAEGAITPCTDDETRCDNVSNPDNCNDTDWVKIGSNTLWDLVDDDMEGHSGKCDAAVDGASAVLHGRVYYATISSAGVTRLAHLNAETMDNRLPQLAYDVDSSERRIIIHENTYTAEKFTARCLRGSSEDRESCFAYTEATSSFDDLNSADEQGGADDLNWCFWTDTKGGEGVWNKFGAAATFGPTIADLRADRNGDLWKTAGNLNLFSENSSAEWTAENGISTSGYLTLKEYISTHYLYYPGAPFNISSGIALIFPVMHFIDEEAKIGTYLFYNMDEETEDVPEEGFVSPGLPAPGAPIEEEASLGMLPSTTPYDEGWVKIGKISATNSTSDCIDPGSDVADDYTSSDCQVRSGSEKYLPGYTGAIFIVGDSCVSASLLQYIGGLVPEPPS